MRNAADAGGVDARLTAPEVYTGLLSCDQCEGMRVVLRFYSGRSYHLQVRHRSPSAPVLESAGRYRDHRNFRTLLPDRSLPEGFPARFSMAEGTMTVSGQATAPGEPGVLSKNNPGITGKQWMLTSIPGSDVKAEPGPGGIPFLRLETAGDRFSGSGGCNRLSGNYSTGEGNRLGFHRIASTKMACRDLPLEPLFLERLQQTASFLISGDTLELSGGNGATLLRFRVDYLE